jgi:diguanylate cyclase (GGDEF)-like protein
MDNTAQVRAQEASRKFRALSTRDLQLWSLGFLTMLVLVSGLLCFLLPNTHANFKVELRYVPQLSMGLIALVLLLNIYVMDQRRELDRVRHQLVRELAVAESFERFAVLDPLTQVFRRNHLRELFDRELKGAGREGVPATFLLIKHHSMQKLVAAYGGASADSFVTHVVRVLQQNFRGADRIVRYSESEFLVLMTGTNRAQAEIAINRLREMVDRWNTVNDSPWEMCLTMAAREFQAGMGPFELIGSLQNEIIQAAAAFEHAQHEPLTPAQQVIASLK